jgi:hypothetical protein
VATNRPSDGARLARRARRCRYPALSPSPTSAADSRYVGRSAPFWRDEVTRAVADHAETLHTLWENAAQSEDVEQLMHDLQNTLAGAMAEVLDRLYPGRVPAELLESRVE